MANGLGEPQLAALLGSMPQQPHESGADRDRTDDLRLAKPALSQLSYSPEECAGPEAPTHFGGGPGQTRTADLTLIRRVL